MPFITLVTVLGIDSCVVGLMSDCDDSGDPLSMFTVVGDPAACAARCALHVEGVAEAHVVILEDAPNLLAESPVYTAVKAALRDHRFVSRLAARGSDPSYA